MHADPLSVPRFAHATDYVGAWAIEPIAGNTLLAVARRIDLPSHVASAGPAPLRSELQLARTGTGRTVGVVPITGVMMKPRSSLGSSTSTVQARRDIRQAANDPDVSAIVLHIDSPGGTVAGTDDLAQDVRAAAKKKPVYAYVEDLCASAAYWVASQADKVYANSPTALVGSVGTLMSVYDLSKAAEKQGVEALVFGTGPLKGTGVPGTVVSAEQRGYLQGLVDSAQGVFDKAVQTGRRMTAAQLKEVKSGGVFGSDEAARLRLIDGLRTFGQVVNEAAIAPRRAESTVAPAALARPPEQLLVVAPFGVASRSRMLIQSGSLPAGHPLATLRWRLQPGCFRACLKDEAAGTHAVKLLADHDAARQLGETGTGTLAVWADDSSLWAAISPEVVARAAAEGLTALSPGVAAASWEVGRDASGPVADITEAILYEVSFVADGNFHGTGDLMTVQRRQAAAAFLAAHGR